MYILESIVILIAAPVLLYRLGHRCFFSQSKEHKVWGIMRFVLTFLVAAAFCVTRLAYFYPDGHTVCKYINIVKSIMMILILVAAAVWLCRLGYQCFWGQSKEHKVRNILYFVLALLVVTALYVTQWEYIYPFERTVKLELYAVIDIPEEKALSYPDWHAIYEKWGIHSGSKWMDTESVSVPFRRLGFDWPDMDFENHTYIVSYGQELVALTYNVWDTVDYPQKTGAKAGHPVFSDVFEVNKVYIYEIEKIRIENDG